MAAKFALGKNGRLEPPLNESEVESTSSTLTSGSKYEITLLATKCSDGGKPKKHMLL